MRSVSVDQQAEINGVHCTMVLFVKMEFSTTLYLCTAGYDITWNSHEWLGMARLAQISPLGESMNMSAEGWSATLAAQPTSILSLALQEKVQGAPVSVWVAWINDDGDIVDVPPLETTGTVDTAAINVEGDSFIVRITVEGEMARWSKASNKRFNDSSHQADYPGDDYFKYTDKIEQAPLVWPARSFFL